MALVDAVGTEHPVAGSDARIVSLVPSVTELLCDLGLASQLVGRTGFCIHPREVVRSIPKVGGTKDVDVDRIRELAPTHLVVNIDENRKETVEELARFVPVGRRHAPACAGGQPRALPAARRHLRPSGRGRAPL